MLVVVSDTGFRKDEAQIINSLFDEGLEIFHLRKQSAAASELKQLLEQIKEKHMDKIALHSHHHLAGYFWLRRLHYTEQKRKASHEKEWQALKENGYRLSSSIHRIEEAGQLAGCFDYNFFGPVFDSISKGGYKGTPFKHSSLPIRHSRLIAIGGIDETNCSKARQMGFNGIAVLGAIWQSSDPVTSFQRIKKAWNSTARL